LRFAACRTAVISFDEELHARRIIPASVFEFGSSLIFVLVRLKIMSLHHEVRA
jgi:hypothetical protein